MGWFSKPSHVALAALGALFVGVCLSAAAPVLSVAFTVGAIGAFVGMGSAWVWGKLRGRDVPSEDIAAAGVVGGMIGFLGGLMAGALAEGSAAYVATSAGRVYEPVAGAYVFAKAGLVGAGAMGAFLAETATRPDPVEPAPPAQETRMPSSSDGSGQTVPAAVTPTKGLVGALGER